MIKKYDLKIIQTIDKYNTIEIPKDVINIINFLAHKVGAPTYKKTPNFRKKHQNFDKITGEDWAAIRNFKRTIIKKNTEGILLAIDEIRCLLNKISNNSYNEIKDQILSKINESNTLFNYEEFMKIGRLVFDIGSLNKNYSHLYAKLYKNLIDLYPVFMEISNTNYDLYSKIFQKINFIGPEEDYNLYCDYNKDNENRKSVSLFFTNLMKEDVFEKEKITHLLLDLIKKMEENLNVENKKEVVEEIVNNISIIIKNTYKIFEKCEDWEVILNHINKYSSANKKNYKSLTTKTVFKYIDLVELIE